MFNFIPTAQAQEFFSNVSSTANDAASAAKESTQSGIQGLFSYVVNNIDNWIAGIILVIVFYFLGSMAAGAIKRAILKNRDDVQESALILVERISKITVLAIGVTIALAINGLNFTAVLGALSLGVGFALKDIIGNFISGVIMLSQNRINIGDFIKVGDGVLGTIVSIDTRATILQAIDGTEIVIPNQTMLGETLVSYTTNPFRRVELPVGVDYKTDLGMVTSLIKGILDKDENVVVKPAPSVIVKEFGESSINLSVRFWVETGKGWMKIRSNIAHKIKQAFDEVGVNIPFPIRTLKVDEDDRTFLKTMDSLKKSFVPEPKKVPNLEEIKTAALHTEHKVKIPYNIFEEGEKQGQSYSKEQMKPTAAMLESMHKIDPTASHEDEGNESEFAAAQVLQPTPETQPAAGKTPVLNTLTQTTAQEQPEASPTQTANYPLNQEEETQKNA